MLGYVISTIVLSISNENPILYHMMCWRWPFLIQTFMLTPLYIALYFVPDADLAILLQPKDKKISQTTSLKDYGYGSMQENSNVELEGLLATPPPVASSESNHHEDEEFSDENRHKHSKHSSLGLFRSQALNASIFDPLSTRNVIKRSTDDLILLDKKDDLFSMLPGFRWSGKKHHRALSSPTQHTFPPLSSTLIADGKFAFHSN